MKMILNVYRAQKTRTTSKGKCDLAAITTTEAPLLRMTDCFNAAMPFFLLFSCVNSVLSFIFGIECKPSAHTTQNVTKSSHIYGSCHAVSQHEIVLVLGLCWRACMSV